MTKHAPATSPLALAAILAASAIPFTAASAQEAAAQAPAPVIVLPPVEAAPPAPAAVPEVPTPPAAAQPAPQPAPEPAASPSARTALRATATSATRPSTRATERSASPVAGPAASETTTIVPPVTVPDAATDPIAPPVAVDPAPVAAAPAAPAEDNGWLIPLALGGIAAGGGIAYAATAGKRRRNIQPVDGSVYRETRNEARVPVREPLATSSLAATVAGATPAAARRFSEPARIPAGPVPTGAERQELIERMVTAAPDAANPFTSQKSRRKRARILLAAAEHRQPQAATEPFDFRNFARFSQQEAGRSGGQQTTRIKETVN